MIADSALGLLNPLMPQAELNHFFNQPGTFELGAGDLMPFATQTNVFRDYNAEVAALQNGVGTGVGAVLYDPEHWQFTPLEQQKQPALYEGLAAQRAHAASLMAIESPALDLLANSGAKGPLWRQYLENDYAGEAAANADVVEIQAQSLELNPQQYMTFVEEAVAQARAANPSVDVIAGLSTYDSQGPVTSTELYHDAVGVIGVVNGFWLNVPGVSPSNPGVTAARAVSERIESWEGFPNRL